MRLRRGHWETFSVCGVTQCPPGARGHVCVCVCVRVMCRHMCVGVVGVGPCGVCVGVALCAPVCPTWRVGVFPVEQIFSPPEPSIPGWLLGPLEGGLGAQVPRCQLSRAAERHGGWGSRDSQQGPPGGQPHAGPCSLV